MQTTYMMERDAWSASIGDDGLSSLLKASVGDEEFGINASDSVIYHR